MIRNIEMSIVKVLCYHVSSPRASSASAVFSLDVTSCAASVVAAGMTIPLLLDQLFITCQGNILSGTCFSVVAAASVLLRNQRKMRTPQTLEILQQKKRQR